MRYLACWKVSRPRAGQKWQKLLEWPAFNYKGKEFCQYCREEIKKQGWNNFSKRMVRDKIPENENKKGKV
jgi:hypothetical protein